MEMGRRERNPQNSKSQVTQDYSTDCGPLIAGMIPTWGKGLKAQLDLLSQMKGFWSLGLRAVALYLPPHSYCI